MLLECSLHIKSGQEPAELTNIMEDGKVFSLDRFFLDSVPTVSLMTRIYLLCRYFQCLHRLLPGKLSGYG